jgi:hypothetical protein
MTTAARERSGAANLAGPTALGERAGAVAPADLTGAPPGEDPVASAGGATEAGATAEGGDSLRERIGDAIDTVQERIDLEGSGARSNDAVEAEAEDPAGPRRGDQSTN